MRKPLDVRLVPAALVAWGSAAVLAPAGTRTSVTAAVVAACAAAVVAVLHVAGPGRTSDGIAVLTLAVAATVAASAAVTAARASSTLADDAAASGATVRLTATVTSDPRPIRAPWEDGPPSRSSVTLRVTRIETGPELSRRAAQDVRLPVSVVGGGAWTDVAYGTSITTSGTLRPADSSRPERYELVRPTRPELVAPENAPLRVAARVRAGLAATVADRDADVAGLVRGMTVGDRAALAPELDEAMRTTGLTHLTAVSGAHVVIVVGTLLALLVLLKVPPAGRVAVLVVALAAFVLLVRPDASVLRAAAMGSVALLGIAAGRPASALPALGTSVVVLLVVDPWLARSFGFVLSVVATGALVLGASPLAAALERRRVPSWLALLVAVPTVAQLACGPVVVLLSPTLPTYAVLANVLVTPVVAPATVSGVLAALLSTASPGLAEVVVLPACWAADWIARVSTTLAGWPGAALPWPEGVPGAVLLAAATLTAWAAVAAIPAVRWSWQDARVRHRRARSVARSRRPASGVRACR
ncbi:competence protein ComEC [Flavimobilis soli]|uniref:Competence protein ComEC n=1 Tax=Flavimobilis soli TaxID=442709 RepID=A0A2A9EAW9_9MICO|nr:ComEC/Rec2 family competence protein [Flavimobilis soli]PFG35350.1 competence protein ComEC [Flavimobilis soli]